MKKCYTIVLLCLISAITATAQTRYWVGPAGEAGSNWNNTANWSASSGGPGGESVPNGAGFDVIIDQTRSIIVDLAAITLNSLKVTNNATGVLHTNISSDITLNSSSAVNPALDIDAGSTLRDSITASASFRVLFASNARGEIDGDYRLGANPSIVGSTNVNFETTASGVVVNVNSTGRVIFGAGGGAVGTAATLNFNAGSFLIFDRNGGITPTANFNTTSTIWIIGNTTNATTLSGSPAVVGNVHYESPGLTPATVNLLLNNGTIIKGNLRILNTNTRKLILTTSPVGASPVVVNVQGNMEVTGNSVVTIGNNSNRPINFQVDGNFTQSSGTVSLQDNNSTAFTTTLLLRGNFTQSGGTFTAASTASSASANLFVVELNGSSNQNVSVSSGTIDNAANQVALRMNNAAGATLLTPLAVGRMDFTNGRLTTTAANLLTINNTSNAALVVANVSDNSFVNGPVRRRLNLAAAYTFPTGKGTNYRIVEVIPNSTTLSEFTAEYFNSNHPDPDVNHPLVGRSTAEYWTVQRNSGSNAAVRLTLEGAVPGSNSGMEILVARYNGSSWQSERGSTGTTIAGDATSGTVASQVMSTFGPFTFGYGPFGALPIKLTEFDATKASGYNNVHWRAECTSTEAIFEIERSTDGQHFQTIATIVADRQRCLQPFDYQDKTATAGTNYYRMKVVDVDKKAFYSRIVAVINKSKGFELVGIYPTLITTGQLKINVTAANRDKAEIYVTNISGQILKRMQVSVSQGENIIYMDVTSLPAGTYQVTGINSEGQTKTMRFIKQ
ncbi:MAG TPA: T9SS type A sorting domain-containing protein [Chitinophagaceae bacterium]|nr:T9SS type A sorting domain-containing protein [Chitinophagaceae bacterium]